MKRLIVLVACLFSLSACSLWPWGGDDTSSAPAQEEPAGPKTIGVISALSESITLADIDSLGWEKGSISFPIGDWRIDDQATEQATRLLRDAGYDVRPLHYAASKFRAPAIDGPVMRGGVFNRERPNLGPIIRRAVEPNNLDYYLVLVEAGATSGAYTLRGIGLLRQHAVPTAYILYHAFLIDGHSGEAVADFHADPLGNGWYELAKIDGPFTDLGKDAWPKPIASWSAVQRQMLQEAANKLLQESLPNTIRQVAPQP